MRISIAVAIALLAAGFMPGAGAEERGVLTYHNDAARSGHFVVPGLTWEKARALRPDTRFAARVAGHLYAQPLAWRAPGSNTMLITASEDDVVQAFDAHTGNELWRRAVGTPVPRSSLPCGNIAPLGITGTPGITLAGADALRASGKSFVPRDQNQRAALTIVEGTLYVAFGGHFGDCGDYRGWVVGVPLREPGKITSWATRARGGGIWAPGGISAVGRELFFATGNTMGAKTFGDGEAVFRLAPDLHRSDDQRDFFAPSNWRALDDADADLGGSNPVPLDV